MHQHTFHPLRASIMLCLLALALAPALRTSRADARPFAPGSPAPAARGGAQGPGEGLTPAEWAQVQGQLSKLQASAEPGGAITQTTYLKSSNTDAYDYYGFSIAISGDTMVVGAIGDATDSITGGEGTAFVYVRSGATWSQQAYLKAAQPSSNFGYDVAIDSDTIVVGTPYEDSTATGVDGTWTASGATDSGAAYVFVRDGTTWSQQAYLKASNAEAGDRFGMSVDVDGDTVVVGAVWEGSAARAINGDQSNNGAVSAGAAYVFTRSNTTWSQQAYLKAANADPGDGFGQSVALDGETIVVGAYAEDSAATGVNGNQADNSRPDYTGAAYVFVRGEDTWSQQAYLKASNTGADDFFGTSVALDDDTIVVGASFEDSRATGVNGDQSDNTFQNVGAAYVFNRSGTTWSQQAYLKASNTVYTSHFGYNLSVAGDTIVVGAPYERSGATSVNGNGNDASANMAGAAYVFKRTGQTWRHTAYLKASNTDAGDYFGFDVGLAGDTIAVAAQREASAATGIDGDQSDDSAPNAGAAYIFEIGPPPVYLPLVELSSLELICTINPTSIPQQDADPVGEVFYTTTFTLPATLPDDGTFYLSSSPTAALPALVDDKINLRAGGAGGTIIFSHAYSTGAAPKPALVEVPRAAIEPYAGQAIYVEFKDVYGTVIRATPVYLIWIS